ncbi:MAG: glycosyltransferase [Planctomycetota bacterium]
MALGCVLLFAVFCWVRWRYVQHIESPVFGWGLLLFELANSVTFLGFIYALGLGGPRHRVLPPPAPHGCKVDVLIPTLNEERALLRRTIRRAIGIEYPHETWVLDDGDRSWLETLCRELGCRYHCRNNRGEGAKAGNLNAVLPRLRGNYIAVFDADALAHPAFLDRTLGMFDNDRVAFVQTPQVFHNVEALECDYDPRTGRYWNGQDLFSSTIQRGFARIGSALCVGSGFVVRRSALDDIGGFPTDSVTEDVHMSMMMHRRGWSSRYLPEALALHLAPDGLGQYWSQHMRWSQGNIQLFFRMLRGMGGLNLGQRLSYLQTVSGYITLMLRFPLRLIAPTIILFGLQAIDPAMLGVPWAVAVYAGWLLMTYALPPLLSRCESRPLGSRALNLLRTGPTIVGCWQVLSGHRPKFVVTPKTGGAPAPLIAYAFPMVIFIANGLGLLAAAYGLTKGWSIGMLAAMFWCAESVVVSGLALKMVWGRRLAVDPPSMVVDEPARWEAADGSSQPLRLIRLGETHAVAMADRALLTGPGRLCVGHNGESAGISATVSHGAARLSPTVDTLEAVFELKLVTDRTADGPQTHDQLLDFIDTQAIYRFFAGLRGFSFDLPDHLETRATTPVPFYRLRPPYPPIRL